MQVISLFNMHGSSPYILRHTLEVSSTFRFDHKNMQKVEPKRNFKRNYARNYQERPARQQLEKRAVMGNLGEGEFNLWYSKWYVKRDAARFAPAYGIADYY